MANELDRALGLVDEVVELSAEISDKFFHDNLDAMDFADSIEQKASSIAEWIEKNGQVTAAQMTALENMKAGAERWLR